MVSYMKHAGKSESRYELHKHYPNKADPTPSINYFLSMNIISSPQSTRWDEPKQHARNARSYQPWFIWWRRADRRDAPYRRQHCCSSLQRSHNPRCGHSQWASKGPAQTCKIPTWTCVWPFGEWQEKIQGGGCRHEGTSWSRWRSVRVSNLSGEKVDHRHKSMKIWCRPTHKTMATVRTKIQSCWLHA